LEGALMHCSSHPSCERAPERVRLPPPPRQVRNDSLKLEAVFQVFQQPVDFVPRVFRRSFLPITELNPNPVFQRGVQPRFHRKEGWNDVRKILDLGWLKLGFSDEALGWSY